MRQVGILKEKGSNNLERVGTSVADPKCFIPDPGYKKKTEKKKKLMSNISFCSHKFHKIVNYF